jgi:hypothetical protein
MKHHPSPTAPTTKPETAGHNTRALWNMIEFKATAFMTSVLPTMS